MTVKEYVFGFVAALMFILFIYVAFLKWPTATQAEVDEEHKGDKNPGTPVNAKRMTLIIIALVFVLFSGGWAYEHYGKNYKTLRTISGATSIAGGIKNIF